jgi:hypothetical protein
MTTTMTPMHIGAGGYANPPLRNGIDTVYDLGRNPNPSGLVLYHLKRVVSSDPKGFARR